MKLITLSVLLMLSVFCKAQTDSTEIKLNQFKDLFMKGLITAPEYEALKQKTLGIQSQPPSVVIVKQEIKPLPQIDSAQAAKFQYKYTGNIIVGVAGITLGTGLLGGGIAYYKWASKDMGQTVTGEFTYRASIRNRNIITGVLCGFGSAALGVGIAALTVGVKQKIKLNRYRRSVGL